VLSPGAITITEIGSQEYTKATPPYTDYKVRFSVCDPIAGSFAHLGTLSDRLAGELKKASPQCDTYETGGTAIRSCRANVTISMGPGEAMGRTSAKASSLDLGMEDSRVRNAFVSQDRYYSDSLNAVCPVEQFAQPVQGQLRAKLGRDGVTGSPGATGTSGTTGSPATTASPATIVKRTIEPVCGLVMQDVGGTAQGNWFNKPGRLTLDDPHLALVHDNIDPRVPVFSVGTSIPGLPSATYSYVPRDTGLINRDFYAIRPDREVYCFEGLAQRTNNSIRILLAMSTAGELRIEAKAGEPCGTGPWQLGAAAVRFER
jgi:hypothetical protein